MGIFSNPLTMLAQEREVTENQTQAWSDKTTDQWFHPKEKSNQRTQENFVILGS